MRKFGYERKFKYLSVYMNEFINAWPNKIKPFDSWVDSIIDKKISVAKKERINKEKRICKYCRREFIENFLDKTKDHIVPISRGGFDRKENRVPCCHQCNQWKSDKFLSAWLDEIIALVRKQKTKSGYDLTRLGLMIGTIKRLIEYVKQNKKKIAMYGVE